MSQSIPSSRQHRLAAVKSQLKGLSDFPRQTIRSLYGLSSMMLRRVRRSTCQNFGPTTRLFLLIFMPITFFLMSHTTFNGKKLRISSKTVRLVEQIGNGRKSKHCLGPRYTSVYVYLELFRLKDILPKQRGPIIVLLLRFLPNGINHNLI